MLILATAVTFILFAVPCAVADAVLNRKSLDEVLRERMRKHVSTEESALFPVMVLATVFVETILYTTYTHLW